MNLALKLYRRLARAFPHEFKLAYGAEVSQVGEDVVDELAKRRGIGGLIRLLADIAIRVPVEYLSEMRHDMSYAARGLLKSPGFALVGIISMGLGMGLTTQIYNSKWQMFLRDLPATANARQLVAPDKAVSYYYIEQFRQQNDLFLGAAAVRTSVPFNVAFQGDLGAKPERVFGQLVSPDFFSVLGVEPQRGRLLSAQLDKPGDFPVVVITDRFWHNRLNSSPNAIGQTLRLNGQPATIVGITPKDFNGIIPFNPSELFVPITAPAALAPELANDVLHQRNNKEFMAILRLAPGVTTETAGNALDAIIRHLDEQDPSLPPRVDKGRRLTMLSAGYMAPLPKKLRIAVSGFFLVLMALIMTIACMNLANMLLARGANRQKEFAIRLSVGASRFRLVRQMLSEGILLSLLGGIAGFAFAYVAAVLHDQLRVPSTVPTEPIPTPDWHVGIFVFMLAIVCGIGFSLAPALRASQADVTPALKEGAALHLPGYRRFGLRNLLMVTQVAGSLMLVLITAFLVTGIRYMSTIQTRFDPHTMYLLSIDPMREGYTPEKVQALFEKLPEQLKAAGVRALAFTSQEPFSTEDDDDPVPMTAENGGTDSRVQVAAIEETVGAGYFAALSEPMIAGREFTDDEQRSTRDGSKRLPAVLNESAARGFFANGSAIGRTVRDDRQSYEVVGVVPDLKTGMGIRQPVVYLPLTRHDFAHPAAGGAIIMARADPGTDALPRIRSAVAALDPTLNIFNVQTLNDYLELSHDYQRFALKTYAAIGVFGLVLAAIGLAGVTAYAVAQRRKEIGIRMALGARKAQVLRLVMREATALVATGTVLGFLGAFALSKILSSLIHEFVESLQVGTSDPRLLAGIPLLLAGLAMLACYLPARKSANIDPLQAVREE